MEPLWSASRAALVYNTIFSCAYQFFLLRVQVECFTSSFILLKILDELCHSKVYEKVRNRLQLRIVAEGLACLHNSSCG